ncbi:hypothetical protein [Chitinophaga niabensis]|uniref:Uncharacterized protein n=1 Tax=Chitinophaga niabensis TaxID=536979 RepID=A0A1N6EZP6_9BACT|nr:hypothetical protein [Chitinophaga niabensis]SIN88459.1 hypothetical protein SAMN04488055_1925 [Chitinophaga niabensis]
MTKKKGDYTVICSDESAAAGKYLSAFIYFVFFAIPIIWLIGMWSESGSIYATDRLSQLYVPGLVLFAIGALFFRGFFFSIMSVISIIKGKAQITVNNDGIKIFEDKFRYWADIELVQLTTDFDHKYIAVKCIDPLESMNYALSHPMDTAEFKDFNKLKDILDNFTDKVKILEF